MAKATLLGLKDVEESNESFVLLGGPTKKLSKPNSTEEESSPESSETTQTEESEDHGASAKKPSSSEASPITDSQTED